MHLAIVWLFAFLGLIPSPSQQPTPESVSGRVEGILVEPGTGLPLQDARILLGRERLEFTDAAGRFVFEEVPRGSYPILAVLAGYANPPGSTYRIVPVTAGGSTDDIVLHLIRGGVISGRVYDDNGEPVSGMPMQLMRLSYNVDHAVLRAGERTETDDLGDYRFYGLPAGEYYLRTLRAAGAPADQRFPPTYYPNGIDPSGAAPITLLAGRELSAIDLNLSMGSAVSVGGRLVLPQPPDPEGVVFAMTLDYFVTPRSSLQVEPVSVFDTSAEAERYELQGFVPGSYDLRVKTRLFRQAYFALASFELGDESRDNLDLVLRPGVRIDGRVVVAGEPSPDLSGMRIGISPTPDVPRSYTGGTGSRLSESGRFSIGVVAPASYRIGRLNGAPDGYYIRSARLAGQELLWDEFDVGTTDRGPLLIEMGTDGGRVEGTAIDADGNPVEDAAAALWPVARRGSNPYAELRAARQLSGGRFTLTGIPPGDYVLMCWASLVGRPPYFNEDFVRPFLASGTRITVEPNGIVTLEIEALPARQNRER